MFDRFTYESTTHSLYIKGFLMQVHVFRVQQSIATQSGMPLRYVIAKNKLNLPKFLDIIFL